MAQGVPETMRAVAIAGGRGDASALHIAELPTPTPKAGEVLVRMAAAGLNRGDVVQRMGFYPPPPGAPETMGLEMAGEVAALGDGVTRWAVGDRVAALLGGGGYAEYVAVDARHLLPVPERLSLVEAGSLPEVVITVWANVFEHGALKLGETLLVHGATSGIGVAAIQMGKLHGARVIATARGAEKAAAARGFGADLAIDATAEDFGEAVKAAGGADVVLDMVGGDYLAKDIKALNPRGRIVFIASQGGAEAALPVFQLMAKQGVVTGSTLRARPADEKARLVQAVLEGPWRWVADGRLKPVVDRTFPLAEAADAHRAMEDNRHVGKIMLTP